MNKSCLALLILFVLVHLAWDLHSYSSSFACREESNSEDEVRSFHVSNFPVRGPIPWDYLHHDLRDMFTMGGRIPVDLTLELFHVDRRHPSFPITPSSRKPNLWSTEQILSAVGKAQNRSLVGAYGEESSRDIFAALDAFPLHGKKVLVVGSRSPWVEAMLVGWGKVEEVWTVDFETPTIVGDMEHPIIRRFHTLSIDELDRLDMQFDALFSYSSLEHDGLGRYEDPINPNADLERMKRLRSYLKRDGHFFLAVPTAFDRINWNAHRVYGKLRYPLLIEGYTLLDFYSKEAYDGKDIFGQYCQEMGDVMHFCQPLAVLKKS